MNARLRHLSAFQRDLLYIISHLDDSYGLGIKSELENYYNEEVNDSRMYQNLNNLVDEGYLEKSSIDQRTNSYTLTEKAAAAIEHRHQWITACVNEQVAE